MRPHHRVFLLPFLVLVLGGLASGCGLRPEIAPTPTVPPTFALAPSATPLPVTPALVLVAPESADQSIASSAEEALGALAARAEMHFVRQTSLPEGDATDIALLLALAPDAGLQAWAAAHTGIQTAGLGINGLQATPNVSVIAPDGLRYDQLGFALGYLAAMTTPEYRIGAFAMEDTPEARAMARGFVAGGTFYCGLCRPLHPPYLGYPVLLDSVPPDLATAGLTTLLAAPAPHSAADLVLDTTAGRTFLVGTGEVPAELAQIWVASADFDVSGALDEVWEQALAGQGGLVMPLGLRYHSVDPARVSPGRLAFAQALLPDLAAGRIDTGVDPATGQTR